MPIDSDAFSVLRRERREQPLLTRFLTGTVLLLSAATNAHAADTYTIDPRHTYPMFEVSHYGFSTQRGRFEHTTGKITIDLASKTGSIDVDIDVASISMGLDAWNKQMRSDSYFNSEKFPSITFRSTHLLFDADRLVGAEGDFTVLGVTRPLKLTVSNFQCGPNPINKKPQCGADASASIRRSDFGMTRALPGISDEVRIQVAIEASKD
jgi:polyisoprenoid-binding protein YceI